MYCGTYQRFISRYRELMDCFRMKWIKILLFLLFFSTTKVPFSPTKVPFSPVFSIVFHMKARLTLNLYHNYVQPISKINEMRSRVFRTLIV